jgi:hypothetical protein
MPEERGKRPGDARDESGSMLKRARHRELKRNMMVDWLSRMCEDAGQFVKWLSGCDYIHEIFTKCVIASMAGQKNMETHFMAEDNQACPWIRAISMQFGRGGVQRVYHIR